MVKSNRESHAGTLLEKSSSLPIGEFEKFEYQRRISSCTGPNFLLLLWWSIVAGDSQLQGLLGNIDQQQLMQLLGGYGGLGGSGSGPPTTVSPV